LSAGVTSTAQALLFTTSGTTSGGSVSGTADFELTGLDSFEITITNTTTSVVDIAQVLDGLGFTLTGGSGVTFTGVTATGFENCTSGSCVSDSVFHDYTHVPPNPSPTVIGSPYQWAFTASGLFAGGGSFKPGGIVNDSITGANGLPNNQHNDFLLGPVAFDFSFITAPEMSDVTFYWGTRPETTTGNSGGCSTPPCGVLEQAPEPGSLALLGLALSGLAWTRRRFKA
jgi:PEP-CTERM motif-containing protein